MVSEACRIGAVLEGSWDLVSKVISTLIGVISKYITIVTLSITLITKSHDPLSTPPKVGTEGPDPRPRSRLVLHLRRGTG